MDNLNRQMLPFDDTLHVHQAGTVRSDNILGSGSDVIFYLITPHADGDCLLFHRKHSAKAATLVNMAGLEYFDAFYQIEQVTQFIVIRDIQFGGSGNQQFALEYRLPVVIENGSIQAYISDVVCTGGTMLNERMQDFLMAVDEYSTACENKQTEQIKSGFADLLKKYIEINDDNAVGEYIRTAYRSSL